MATTGPLAAPLAWLRLLVQLGKVRVTFVVTLSVATGYLLFAERLEAGLLLPILGTFLAACGSSALNQVQEIRIDRRMRRTRNRPLPAGRIDPAWALFIAFLYLAAGFNLLALVEHHTSTVLLLTALTVVWYNGIYTYLKRLTAFAVAPGSLVGALPPAIGWCAAGGVLSDPAIVHLCFFLFLWQLPHFWLLLLLHGKDYEQAGLPSATARFSSGQLSRITFVWVLATIAAGLLLATTAGTSFPWNLAFLAASAWIIVQSLELLRATPRPRWELGAFMRLNLYALLAMALLVGSALS